MHSPLTEAEAAGDKVCVLLDVEDCSGDVSGLAPSFTSCSFSVSREQDTSKLHFIFFFWEVKVRILLSFTVCSFLSKSGLGNF